MKTRAMITRLEPKPFGMGSPIPPTPTTWNLKGLDTRWPELVEGLSALTGLWFTKKLVKKIDRYRYFSDILENLLKDRPINFRHRISNHG